MEKEQFSDETGGADDIDRLLASRLQRIGTDASGWILTYRDNQTGQLWELTYPRGEMHGGGPRLLTKVKRAER